MIMLPERSTSVPRGSALDAYMIHENDERLVLYRKANSVTERSIAAAGTDWTTIFGYFSSYALQVGERAICDTGMSGALPFDMPRSSHRH